MREFNDSSDIDRGLFELVIFYLLLMFVEFMCLVFICLLQNQNNYNNNEKSAKCMEVCCQTDLVWNKGSVKISTMKPPFVTMRHYKLD